VFRLLQYLAWACPVVGVDAKRPNHPLGFSASCDLQRPMRELKPDLAGDLFAPRLTGTRRGRFARCRVPDIYLNVRVFPKNLAGTGHCLFLSVEGLAATII
jgi:hypothetical protein